MSFLAPLFLFGFLFIAGPVLFHLIRQVPRKRVLFSSTEFLEQSEPKTENARTLQNPWLLLIRCLIVALLTFAFARPFFPNDEARTDLQGIRDNVVLAIDQSASMAREGIAEARKQAIAEILESLKSIDQVAVLLFSDTTSVAFSPQEWNSLPPDRRAQALQSRIEQIEPSNFPASLAAAIEEAIALTEAMQEDSAQASFSTIHLLSDFSNGMYPQNMDSIEWPQYLELVRHPLAPSSDTVNLGLSWNGWTESEKNAKRANLAISSSDPTTSVFAELSVSTRDGTPVADALSLRIEGQHKHLVQIEIPSDYRDTPLIFQLSGDRHSFDNTLAVSPNYIQELEVAVFSDTGIHDAKAAPYFVSKALSGLESPRSSLALNPNELEIADAYLIDRPLSTNEVTQLREELSKGKHALLTLASNEFLGTLRELTGSQEWTLESSPDGSLLVGDLDLRHPLFAPFVDPRYSNFSGIQFWKAKRLAIPEGTPAKILSRYDEGSPLLVEFTIGSGTLYLWVGSWQPSHSQWVLSSKFVPFMHQFLLGASGGPSLPSNSIFTTESVSRYRSLLDPSQAHDLGFQYSSDGKRTIAFQLAPEESLTSPFSADEWDQLGLPERTAEQRQRALAGLAGSIKAESDRTTEQRQNTWQAVLWIVLALLVLESALAIAANRRKEAVA